MGLLEFEVFALLFYERGRQVGTNLVIKKLFKKLDITPLKVIGKDENGFPIYDFEEATRVAIEALSRPSLPSNLDEAAEEWVRPIMRIPSKAYEFLYTYLLDAFRKGAEWMARQGASFNTEVGWIDGPTILDWPDDILDKFELKDKVIVQIRKIQ